MKESQLSYINNFLLNPEALNKFEIDIDWQSKRIRRMLKIGYKSRKNYADEHFSKAIRSIGVLRFWLKKGQPKLDSNIFPVAECVTCGKVLPYKKCCNIDTSSAQCGHYVTRNHILCRFDYFNCSVQSYLCNEVRKGEQAKHAKYIDKLYGPGTSDKMDQLGELSKRGAKFSSILLIEVEEKAKIVVKSVSEIINYPLFKEKS